MQKKKEGYMSGNGGAKEYYIKLKTAEKAAYGFWGFGSDLVFQTVTIYLTFFYTDIFGISAAQVTTLFLVARVWDAINDPMMGALCEKFHFKMGKYRSWMFYLAIPYGISTLLVFTTPNIGTMKVAFAWVTYIAFSMLFTGMIIPATSLSSSMTQDPVERTSLNSFRMFCSGVGGVACAILVPYISTNFGATTAQGYQIAMGVLAVIMVISFMVAAVVCKERVPEVESAEPFRFRDVFEQFSKNKPLLLLFVLYLAAYTFNIMVSSVGTYFVTYNMGRSDLLSTFSLMQTLPSIVPLLFVPLMVRHMGKKKVALLGCSISLIGCILVFLSPNTMIVPIFAGKAIGAFGYGILLGILWSTLPDTVEYGEYVTGRRCGGVIYSLASFSIKISLTIAGIVPTIVLGAVGYVANGVQTEQCLFAIKALNSLIPAIFLVVGLVAFSRYNLTEKRFEEIVEELHERHNNKR
jgi:glycoside/pentoside/hexuronide:cation symporter, GPH family